MLSAVTLLLACSCGLLAASPTPVRMRRDLVTFPAGGLPIELLFASCGGGRDSDSADIGPCVEELLSGAIELARPGFATGVEFGGKTKVLEPLTLKDINVGKNGKKKLNIDFKQVQIHHLSTLAIRRVSLTPERVVIGLDFDQLTASADMELRYKTGIFPIRGSSEVTITLIRPSVTVSAGWNLDIAEGKPVLRLVNPEVDINIAELHTKLTKLGGLGRFLQQIINNNDAVLLQLLTPKLEEQAGKILREELQDITLPSLAK